MAKKGKMRLALAYNDGADVPEQIRAFLHCRRCLAEKPKGQSPRGWQRVQVGMTDTGLQVWCVRHDMNVALVTVTAEEE